MSYFPPGEFIIASLFLLFLWQECKMIAYALSIKQIILVTFFWQLPVYIFQIISLPFMESIFPYSHYFVFLIQFWHTPLFPFLSFATHILPSGMPLYFTILIWLSPVLFLVFLVTALIFKKNKKPASLS